MGYRYDDATKESITKRIAAGETITALHKDTGIPTRTLFTWRNEADVPITHPRFSVQQPGPPKPSSSQPTTETPTGPKILIYDIETLPNISYCWDTFSKRPIPLEFIIKPKSICTIAYKWYGSPETQVLVIDTPYDDRGVLEAFLPEVQKADYMVAHYSRFDKPFIAARLMANGLPSLPPVNDVCTYRLAKTHFGRSLNGNRLDHLGEILGLGRKIKTNADLWVKCAEGDKEALASMSQYNARDVDLLADVFKAMLPHVKSKLNFNLLTDEPILRCKQCGSDKLEHRGYEYTAAAMRHRHLCLVCGSWNCFPKGTLRA